MDIDLDALAVMNRELDGALSHVTPDSAVLPTPCADWALADLVDHIAGGNWFTIAILNGRTASAAVTEARERFETGSTSTAAAAASIHEQATAFAQPGVLDATWHHVAGELTGREILRIRLHDLIVHTWDVRETLMPPGEVSAALVEWGLRELATPGSPTADHFGVGLGDRISSGAADDAATYLRSFGRTP